MSRFGVRPEKEKLLMKRMARLGIREADFEETFVRSQGSGGQRLNKTATCVWLKHLPTGLAVKVQRERHQGLNRFLARRALLDKYETEILGVRSAAQKRQEKIRKQKKRRKRRSKRKNTASKNSP